MTKINFINIYNPRLCRAQHLVGLQFLILTSRKICINIINIISNFSRMGISLEELWE